MPKPPSEKQRSAALQVFAISWNFGWPVAAGVIVGYWLDDKLGTSPWITLLLGLGAMSAAIWRLIVLSKEESSERRRGEAVKGPTDADDRKSMGGHFPERGGQDGSDGGDSGGSGD